MNKHAIILCCGLAAAALPASAQTLQSSPLTPPAVSRTAPVASVPAPTGSLLIDAGSGRVIQSSRPIANLFAADPKVAEARPASATSVFIFGVTPGRTTVAALDQAGGVIAQYEVTVRPSGFGASEAAAAIHRALPHHQISVQTTAAGLALSGSVTNATEAEQAASIARSYLTEKQTLDNRLSIVAAEQVNLRVRIAEISRQVTRRFGINWSALGTIGKFGIVGAVLDPFSSLANPSNVLGVTYRGGSVNANAILDLLAQDNLATILAEPNLTATNGETASFLAGGEYPIPVAQANQTITIAYKQYGVSLAFVPTILSGNRISLRVRPEVSQLTTQGAIQLGVGGNNSVQVPALTVRRAETTVELGSGQSFAIAGLLQRQNTLGNSGLPYAGEIPVLGPLFRSDNFQRNETELVILVTPYLVHPADGPGQIHAPTDNYAPPNDIDRVLLNRQLPREQKPELVSAHLPGDAGFILK
ncbi:MAG TPA: type II and III secretion system protein family protein [Acetobacteraceae bacterium]